MTKRFLCSLFLFFGCFLFPSFLCSADTWGQYDFNTPRHVDISSVDTSTNYWSHPVMYYMMAISSSFPQSPYSQATHNSYLIDEEYFYDHYLTTSGSSHYMPVSGLETYDGKLVLCITIQTRTPYTTGGHTYGGASFWCTDNSNIRVPCTMYRNGQIYTPSNGRFGGETTPGVYHYEIIFDCSTVRLQRIHMTYGWSIGTYFFTYPSDPTRGAFDLCTIYKFTDDRSFTLSASAYTGGKFSTFLSQNFVDCDYRCLLLYADMPSFPVSGSSSSTSDSSKDPLEDFPDKGKDAILQLLGSGSAETEEDTESAFIEYKSALQSRLNRVLESGYSTLQDMMRDANAWVQQNSDDIWVGVISPSQMQTIQSNIQSFGDYFVGGTSGYSTAPFSSIEDAVSVITKYMGDCVWANYATNAYLDSETTTCPVSFVDASLYYQYQIFDTTSNYYLSYSSPVSYNFDVGTFYRAYGSRSDFPSDGIVSFIYLIYDDDICVCAFRLDVDITQYVYSTITTIGDSIKITPLPSLSDDSTLDIDTSSGVDDFTRREMSLYLRDLMDVYYKNISAQLTNIYNIQRYNNSYSYVNYNYALQVEDVTDVAAYYDFDSIVLDSGLDAGMRLSGELFTDFVTDYHLDRYLLFLLGIAAISFILYGRK